MNYINTERWEKWLADGGSIECQDHKLTIKIPSDIGSGVKMIEDGVEYFSDRSYQPSVYFKKSKIITLSITTYKGISGDAIHYYGRLEIPCLEFFHPNKNNHSTFSSSGYGVPQYLDSGNIELTRLITEKDMKSDRFEGYHIGYPTERFDSVNAVIERGKSVFSEWFDEGWTLKIEKKF
jgi:hypothetical protein